MKQIIYAGLKNNVLKSACEKMFRCTNENEIDSFEKFTKEVMTDAILCDMEKFKERKKELIELSQTGKIPVIVIVENTDDMNEFEVFLENTLFDFILKNFSAEELNLRIEKITATKNMNLTLRNMSMIQHEVNRMAKLSIAGELISSVNHMINNPITAINLQLDLMKMDKTISKELLNKIESVETNIERIISIISTIRELKLGISETNELVNINEETSKYIPLLHDYFINHSITINFEIEKNLPPLRLFRGLLKYIFLEIMLLLFHRCNEKKGGKVNVSIISEKENVRFIFKTNFNCSFNKFKMDLLESTDQFDKSDVLTINALRADVTNSNGIMTMKDKFDGSVIIISLSAAVI